MELSKDFTLSVYALVKLQLVTRELELITYIPQGNPPICYARTLLNFWLPSCCIRKPWIWKETTLDSLYYWLVMT